MKKASRLIAILLTACLLFATACIFASAEDTNQFDPTNLGDNIQNLSYVTGGLNNNVSVTANFVINSAKSTQGGNTYHRFSKRTSYTTAGVTYDLTTLEDMQAVKVVESALDYANASRGHKLSSAIDTSLYSYTVVSFDFMSDAADEDGKLLYADGSWFGLFISNVADYVKSYVISDSDGNWYISSDKANPANGVPISGKVGEWNNLTYVFNGKSCHAFVNGVHFATKTTSKVPTFDRVVYSLWDSTDIYTNFSVGMDQLSIYSYGTANNAYVTEDFDGLDDFIGKSLYNSMSLSSLDDVIFNTNYSFGDNVAVSTIKGNIGGNEKTYHDFGQFAEDVAACKAGDYFVTDYNVEGFIKEKTKLDVIKGVGDGVVKYTVVSSGVSENENIFESLLTSVVGVGNASHIGYGLKQTSANGVYDIYMNTPYDGKADNVNFHHYFTMPGYANGNLADHRSYYPTSANYKYATLDFNLSAAEYIYIPDANEDGVIDETDGTVYSLVSSLDELSDCERATAKLSYYQGARMSSMPSTGWAGTLYYVSDDDGNWYLSTSSSYSESGVNAPLSNVVGENNHVTMIYDFVAKKISAFVNDKFVASFTGQAQVARFAFIIIQNAYYSPCRINVKDIQVNYYKTAYESLDKVLGLDDYIGYGKYADYNLSFVDDVVANERYFNGAQRAKIVTADGDTFCYTSVAAALAAAETGDTIYYDGALTLYDYINSDIEKLSIVADSVTLVDGSNASVLHTYDPDTGTLNRKNVYILNWYNENDEYVTEYVVEGGIPNYGTVTIETALKGDYNQINAWEWAAEGETVYAPLATLTDPELGAVYNVRPLVAPVEWIDGSNNENFIIEEWFVGSVAENDFANHEELDKLDNGWYELEYFWTDEDGELVSDFTVGSEGAIFTSDIRPVSVFTLSEIKVNFTLNAQYVVNFYVPVPVEDVTSVIGKYATNISCSAAGSEDGRYDDLTEAVSASKIFTGAKSIVNIGGEEYYKFTASTLSAFTWYSAVGFEMDFAVEYDGEEYEFSSQVAIVRLGSKNEPAKSVSYISTVMAKECGNADKVLILNWMRYINLAYRSQGSLVELSGATTYKNHYDCCGIEKDLAAALPTAAPEHAAPTGVIATEAGYSASYYMTADYGVLQITVPKTFADEAGDKLSIYTSFTGVDNEKGCISNVKYVFNKVEGSSVKIEGVDCYYYRLSAKTGIYNINAVQNISIEVDGEIVGSIEYSFAKYLYNTNVALGVYTLTDGAYVRKTDEKTESEYIFDAALALSLFGEAAYNYKFVE